jgi:hypothetical protein
MVKAILLLFFAFFLESNLSLYFSSTLVLISLLYLKKKPLFLFLVGLIYDLAFTNILFLHSFLFLITFFFIKEFNLLNVFLVVIIYRVSSFLILSIIMPLQLNSLTQSILAPLILNFLYYCLLKKLSVLKLI